ncbi:hypothetical protein [Flavobacterium sp.]|uniref:hypothetical protein n=1 Tax=Flavobacterium sp. TaxID=239 RepID=UPI003BC64231
MTLEEREKLLILFKEHFEYAFVNLTDNDTINIDKTKFDSVICPVLGDYSKDIYNALKEDWESFRNVMFKRVNDVNSSYLVFFKSEMSFVGIPIEKHKFRYSFIIDVRFNKVFQYNDFPWLKDVEVYDALLIDPINKLKYFLKHDDLFKNYQLKLLGERFFHNQYVFSILIVNIKDFYEMLPYDEKDISKIRNGTLPAQWKLIDEVNP